MLLLLMLVWLSLLAMMAIVVVTCIGIGVVIVVRFVVISKIVAVLPTAGRGRRASALVAHPPPDLVVPTHEEVVVPPSSVVVVVVVVIVVIIVVIVIIAVVFFGSILSLSPGPAAYAACSPPRGRHEGPVGIRVGQRGRRGLLPREAGRRRNHGGGVGSGGSGTTGSRGSADCSWAIGSAAGAPCWGHAGGDNGGGGAPVIRNALDRPIGVPDSV